MAGDPLWINASVGVPEYTANEMRQAMALGVMYGGRNLGARQGVRPGGDQLLTTLVSTTITVKAGVAYVDPALNTPQGGYWVALPADETFTLTAADATNPRKDITILRVYDHDEDSSGLRTARSEYLVGTPNPSPVEPSVPAGAFKLALIDVPAQGGGSASVTDRRPWTVAPGGILPVAAAGDITAAVEGRYRDRLDINVLERDSGAAWEKVADPAVWKLWDSWTPTWSSTGTAPSVGNGTLVGRQKRIGEVLHVFVRLTWGSTTTGGTGDWQFTLPVTPNFSNQILPGLAQDLSLSSAYPLACRITTASPEIIRIGAHNATGAIGRLSATHPFTWGDTDVLTIQGTVMASG